MHAIVHRALVGAALAILACPAAVAQRHSTSTPSPRPRAARPILSSPQRTMDAFFVALNSFDANAYAALLTDDASLFFTGAPFPLRRVQGRDQIMKLVTPLLDAARAKGAKGTIVPYDILYQTWGDTSVVTFHIPVGSGLDRRTFVLRRLNGAWRIAHLHASIAQETQGPPRKGG